MMNRKINKLKRKLSNFSYNAILEKIRSRMRYKASNKDLRKSLYGGISMHLTFSTTKLFCLLKDYQNI